MVLDHLSERPEGHAAAVRERPALAPRDEVSRLPDREEELEYEPRLPDPRLADERDRPNCPLVHCRRQGADERLELLHAVGERDLLVVGELDAGTCPRRDRRPGGEELLLAFHRDR